MSGVVNAVGNAVSDVGNFVTQNIVPLATTAAAVALAPETGGASLALDASAIASADSIALSTYGVSAAEAMSTYGATAAELGLPAAATAADVGAVAGTASAEFAGTEAGQQAIGMTAQAVTPAVAQTPQTLASQLGYSDPIAAIAGGVNPTDLGMVQSGTGGLSNLVGYAQTGAQLIGGLGKLAGGVAGLTSGAKVNPQQAGPLSQYQPQFASQLYNLLQNPSTITSTPGYQFNLSNYMQQLQAKQAAQGSLVGGGALVQAGQMGQQYATSSLQQQQQLLQQLTSMAPSQAGAVQNTALTNTANTFGGIGAIAQGLGVASGLSPLDSLYANYNKSSPSVSS
jgi:hypothetical protein